MLQSCYQPGTIEAGCDEAGRGCLAGPVYAAAVVLPTAYKNPLLNDSKTLSAKQRNTLRTDIEENALAWAVCQLTNVEIDKHNILKSSIMAMHKALQQLSVQPQHIIVDGNRFYSFGNIRHTCVVKGDGKYMSIAAASILAKTHRDEYMENLHHEFPHYNWLNNKGYPTKAHRQAIERYGACMHHRKTFKLFDTQVKINF
ncbi:MAG: ribonuclease HII [Bacteroidales bacterium]|nr:ribonuclease HII [Bacteroidales bacterium]